MPVNTQGFSNIKRTTLQFFPENLVCGRYMKCLGIILLTIKITQHFSLWIFCVMTMLMVIVPHHYFWGRTWSSGKMRPWHPPLRWPWSPSWQRRCPSGLRTSLRAHPRSAPAACSGRTTARLMPQPTAASCFCTRDIYEYKCFIILLSSRIFVSLILLLLFQSSIRATRF